ncbi:MAG TPA: histidine phosphatase family protein [Ktedonobacteraceae bacterium]|nr:histidine phosphatase family protein [Ktedonobacteraceae bacterium]
MGMGLLHVLWIYLYVGMRFLRWRIQLWSQRYHMMGSAQNRMKQTLLLIRHGQTTWNVENRLPGQIPGVELTETGKQQATRLAEALSSLPISAIISSPLERARDTAAYIAKGRDLEIQFEADLMDTKIGHWTGQVIRELAQNDPAWKAYVKDPTVAPEGVETFPQVQQRVVAAVERWLTKDIGAYPAFVAHADVIKLIIAYYTGLEPGRAGSLLVENASVSVVEVEKEQRPRVLCIGWSPRPGWLTPPIEAPKKAEPEQEAGEQQT